MLYVFYMQVFYDNVEPRVGYTAVWKTTRSLRWFHYKIYIQFTEYLQYSYCILSDLS